ncbi:MAG TPA: site-specific DNA-methyltransferase [Candidatus Marinimicrobia bacterium]|jgi:site-specific DNA-methyltransferase (adenine-specific)|nr:site-specific DNA-methyltransferase [Candidatus Neomarinimicrobiota bacterium]MDP6261758.1 site-specific DNA-methyltransferase [Candidatus Neomarinimicrobiota bacterium]MDP7128374.1 site-specific DNA-methyltransferase [Candidatus Neomarinimicrobiota bacterium]MDP7336547.1 site-specific DNA-methyltransferase [Candidatus Neomarinimicrobiota bacterium]MDP7475561.1 site-specific DNA-methyltransferase [Candidatus Neomarinimicrobiota bacterium]|tara:strand:- start:596 stop:1426 length:831 start_codon:yes stop_codon:yes gene_type:complete
MNDPKKEAFNPLFTNPLEAVSGMTVSDLNRYLPAVRQEDEIKMTRNQMEEGLFLADGIKGLARLPDNTIDLIVTNPPESPWKDASDKNSPLTLQEYYQWNEKWLEQSFRVLKPTGSIYLICGWRYSGMYHALLSNNFNIQSRITWRNNQAKDQPRLVIWRNVLSDIWFATKTNEFMFDQKKVSSFKEAEQKQQLNNFWADIIDIQIGTKNQFERGKPEEVLKRIFTVSSFKLNWVVDPFMGRGSVGIIAKKTGRRFIGFETDQDQLLMAMKRIDQT